MASDLYAEKTEGKETEASAVNLWQERISIGKKKQDMWAEDSGAKRFLKEYKGDFGIVFQARTKKIPIPPINEVFAYVQSDIATTYNRDPYITCNAKAGTVKGAAFWEVIINYYWRELKTKEELEYEILEKDLIGHGWHKVGYTANSLGTGEKLKIEDELLYSNYLCWKDVLFNLDSKRPPFDSRWMAQRIVKPIKDIRKKYKIAAKLEGSPSPDLKEEEYKKSTYKDDVKVGVIWEIWDADEKQVYLMAEGLKDKWLEPPRLWPDYLDEFPFLMYWDFAIPGSPYPMSAIAPWEAQLLEEMVLMGSAINHVKRWNRQLFYNGGEIDENAMDKYERGDDGAMIRMNGKVGSDDLRLLDYGQLPTDFYLIIERLQASRRSINGQPEFARGGVTKTGTRTVGELQLMEQGTKGRQDRKIDRLETHCENIARHMMAHLKANFDFGSAVKITGDIPPEVLEAIKDHIDPVTKEVKFTDEDIKGEYDLEIKAGSTLPIDKQHRIQMYETVMQTVAMVVSKGPMSPFLNALIQGLLQDYDLKALQQAYEEEVAQAQKAAEESAGQQSIEDQKIGAETMKRQAQARQIAVDTEIAGQEAQIGPVGRALAERLKKPPPKPATNGASR